MADANSSAVVLAGGRAPKDEKARKKKAKVNVQEQPLYPYKLPVHQPGVDGFYCTYGCGSARADGGGRRAASAGGRSSWTAEGGTGARSRGRIRPVTVMYPEEGFVCCHQGHEPGEEEVDEFDGTEYDDEEEAELVVGGEEEEDYVEEYEEYEEEEDKERSGGRGVMGGGGGGGRGFFGFGGGGKSGGARRSRDSHGGAMASGTGGGIDSGGDSHYHGGHYRTHIFMSPLGGRQGEPLLVGGKGGMYAMDEMVPAGGLSSSGAGPLAEQGGRRGGGGGSGSGAAVTLMKWKEAGGGGKRRKPKSGEDPQQHSAQRPRPPTPPLVLPPPVPAGTMLQEDEGRSPYGKQVSFGGGGPGGGGGGGAGTVLSLAALDRDCFIIPVASLDRFLPAGVTLPAGEKKKGAADGHGGTAPATSPTSPSTVSATFLSVLEVEEPRVVVAAHLMTALRPVRPELESPLEAALTHRTNRQRGAARELLTEVAAGDPRLPAARALLLDNMEDNAHFPFISYYVINKRETDAGEFFRRLRVAALRKFEPRSFHYTAAHTVELFSEVATIARPPFNSLHHHAQFVSTSSATAKASEPSELTSTGSGTGASNQGGKTTGYIISVYKVFEGDDREIFEKNWLYWTGARMLYRYLPKWVELRRITLHKSLSRGDKVYLLLCECANFPDDLSAAALLLPALRARLCGYTGLYRASASL